MAGKRIDLSGQKFGRLTVLRLVIRDGEKRSYFLCRCDCGVEKEVRSDGLTSGQTQSCGCLKAEIAAERIRGVMTTHGLSSTGAHATWKAMKQRCYDENADNYKHYGGRGITVCDRWKDSFQNFYDDMGDRPEHHSIERIDNEKPYGPGNCRWAVQADQVRNSRQNRNLTIRGETMCLDDWCRRANINPSSVRQRLKKGMDPERAVFDPPKRTERRSKPYLGKAGRKNSE